MIVRVNMLSLVGFYSNDLDKIIDINNHTCHGYNNAMIITKVHINIQNHPIGMINSYTHAHYHIFYNDED